MRADGLGGAARQYAHIQLAVDLAVGAVALQVVVCLLCHGDRHDERERRNVRDEQPNPQRWEDLRDGDLRDGLWNYATGE